jgi:transposase-like protein
MSNPFRYFNSSPEVIRLVVMMYVVNGKLFYLWRAVDHEGEVLDAVLTHQNGTRRRR